MNFYSFILLAVEAEVKLEQIRMSLASIDSFESHTTYKRLDQPRTGGLKPENIFEFLCDNDIEVTQDQLDYIFRVLDEDSDGFITSEDFKSAILPKMNAELKEQALNHKGYDLPVDMLLPQEIETQLSLFMNQIKQNYLQMIKLYRRLYQEIQQKIDLNQLDIYDNSQQITVDSLKKWLQQLGSDISEEVLQNFVHIIQGQQQSLQILLDKIYTDNEEDQDQDEQEEEEEEANDNENEEEKEKEEENYNQEKQQEDIEQIQQKEELEQAQQNDVKDDQDVKDSLQNNRQDVQSQELSHNNMDYQHSYNYSWNDIEFEISYLKKKISLLERQLWIVPQPTFRFNAGQRYEYQNRDLLYYSRKSYLRKFDESPSYYSDDNFRLKLWLDQEIKNEELKQQMLLIQLKNYVKVSSSGLFTDIYQSRIYQSPLRQSLSYLDYSGQKQSGSYQKAQQTHFQRSLNFSNRKF
ncbi:unnamed protein product (macronuclear) [Paramecium tetraurelia]|uniref:EF-hand domain-containing protein n=1 Tax=Paramecium tetraurelia TaxID=5888 RepID=A0CSJ4_PARTE|nr:uncharacterized protein GSPATT00010033001 [Paramecium tetraurelia]CAK73761.1 unnamed protein product [Paramecium tetraurelia]|eukprot:XP_001441158.1 hypothetical protein (macronuclear) [Paramecium tetraurelia strain d4-2]